MGSDVSLTTLHYSLSTIQQCADSTLRHVLSQTHHAMKKVALVFVIAVIVPSLVLAWLAARSLRDQMYVLDRQQTLLYQNLADAQARAVAEHLGNAQRSFAYQVEG